MKIAIGADHGGFSLKESLKNHLAHNTSHQVVDYGTYDDESCDYPDFALLVADAVANGAADRGIMVDTTGIASTIVGNKVAGVRATCPTCDFTVRSSRVHNNSNMLVMGAELMGVNRATKMMEVWLKTEFAGGRHQRRVDKINRLDGGR
jgi:ribose 5-phosphate isomerase B